MINSNQSDSNILFCESYFGYKRRETLAVKIGHLSMGGQNPIRIQSMTTVDTMDTEGSVSQILRMVESGCEYVRITAPSIKEAENLKHIKDQLVQKGCEVPLIADIHFTPNAAEMAAEIVEKVRINPGNYADKKRFENIEYTEEAYQAELMRIKQKFTPLVKICKAKGTAMRIGTNHGSLSDRIMSRYGDTPNGMVESALEFLRICEDLEYFDVVISMKSSNPQVMVQAYRLLSLRLKEEGLRSYPLHLGVTEAGEAEDGRIKSALGIGTLLEDGLGDTIRVSLTEEPEHESPVAKILADRIEKRNSYVDIEPVDFQSYNPFEYKKRSSIEVKNIGGENVPRVIADLSDIKALEPKDLKTIGHFYLSETDKWAMNDIGCDYVYSGANPISFMLPNGLREILDYKTWVEIDDKQNTYPIITTAELEGELHPKLNFLKIDCSNLKSADLLDKLKATTNMVLLLSTNNSNALSDLRAGFMRLVNAGVTCPVIIHRAYPKLNFDAQMMFPATDIGGLLIDGFGDGAMISTEQIFSDKNAYLGNVKRTNEIAFGILQAARTRITKTEYISCPSCGRTLFDLQETTAMIRKRTDHLKGIKIGIMGCIVNGPGEMADADYGYVGSGKGKITLYKGQEVMKKGVASTNALDELINLIKEDGRWIEPTNGTN